MSRKASTASAERVLVDRDLADAACPVPERRHLANGVETGLEHGCTVGQRPVRRPHVDRDGAGRERWFVVASAGGSDGGDHGGGGQQSTEHEAAAVSAAAAAAAACAAAVRRHRRLGIEQRREVGEAHVAQRRPQGDAGRRFDVAHVGHTEHPTTGSERRADAGGGVLDRHAVGRVGIAQLRAEQIRDRTGLALTGRHIVTGHDGGEGTPRQPGHHRRDEAVPRHRHQRARNAGLVQLAQQPACAGSPRDVLLEPGDDPVEHPLDEFVRIERDARLLDDVVGRLQQVEPHHRLGVVLRPLAAERLDDLALRLEPVRLGVDERAVHVPQHRHRQRRRSARCRAARAHSWTSSMSVPKLPFGCTNATVVPREPGRGAWSIAVAPAATIAASAAAQSSTR